MRVDPERWRWKPGDVEWNFPEPTQASMGDVPGHEFHGNRWTGGIGGGISATDQIKEADAIRAFGLTDNIHETGYITPSGKMLDFSGRSDSTNPENLGEGHAPYHWDEASQRYVTTGRDWLAGQRAMDHREIPASIYSGPREHGGQELPPLARYSDPMHAMLDSGFVRIMTSTGIDANITRPLSDAQIRTLTTQARIVSSENPDATLEFAVEYTGTTRQDSGMYFKSVPISDTVRIGRALREANVYAQSHAPIRASEGWRFVRFDDLPGH